MLSRALRHLKIRFQTEKRVLRNLHVSIGLPPTKFTECLLKLHFFLIRAIPKKHIYHNAQIAVVTVAFSAYLKK